MAVQSIPSTGNYKTGNTTPRREESRSFADLYQQALRNKTNDNTGDNQAQAQRAADVNAVDNQKYIETLHEKVDTLRGEILARVIQTASTPTVDPRQVTDDITRLSVRLDKLRQKLQSEETRLSGKLIDISV